MKTIEQMAEDAGFSVPGGRHYEAIYRPAGASATDDISEHMKRFAAMVAQRCAELAMQAGGNPHHAATLIGREFPKP